MSDPAPALHRSATRPEVYTAERVYISELWNDDSDQGVSIARARVEPGVTTVRHTVTVDERYLILSGRGWMEVEGMTSAEVGPGDVVFIPAGVAQRITNTGDGDLLFFCLCTPRFTAQCYRACDE